MLELVRVVLEMQCGPRGEPLYDVITARSGEEALCLLDVVTADAALVDVGLPANGGKLVDTLRERWPGMRLAFFTGRTQPMEKYPDVPVIYKPFVIERLLEQVQSILAAPPPPQA